MQSFGWIPDSDGLNEVIQSQPNYNLLKEQVQVATSAEGEDEGDIFLWRYLVEASGGSQLLKDPLGGEIKRLASLNQSQLGSCVGFGTARGLAITQATDIKVANQPEIWKHFPAPGELYSGSRTVANRLAAWEGSTNSWSLKLINEFGIPYETTYLNGKYDLRSYDIPRAKKWQTQGMPKELIEQFKDHKLSTFFRITDAAELWTLVGRGYGVNICSNFGFQASKRDKDGFLKRNGNWSHSMYICGRRTTTRKGFLVGNSWGSGWMEVQGSGKWPEDMPCGSFWVDYKTIDDLCKHSESEVIAYGDIDGFKRPKFNTDTIGEW